MSVITAVLLSMPLVAVALGVALPWRVGAPLLLGLVAILGLAMHATTDEDVDGEPPQLGAGLELSLYRLLQHALAAVDQRAPLAVHLRYRPDHLELEVCGPAARTVAADEALHAARERASVHGGSFRVAPGEPAQDDLPVSAAPLSVAR